MQGRAPVRTLQTGDGALCVDAREREPLLELHGVGGADAGQIAPGLVVAPHQHMLAVVHVLARLAIEEGRGAPAQLSAGFEHEHPRAPVGQRAGRRQAGAARSDDDHVRRGHFATRSPADAGEEAIVRIHVERAIRALWNFGTRTRSVNTSKSRASMRASRSR